MKKRITPLGFSFKINWESEMIELYFNNAETKERTSINVQFEQWDTFYHFSIKRIEGRKAVCYEPNPKYFKIIENQECKRLYLSINGESVSIPYQQSKAFSKFLLSGPYLEKSYQEYMNGNFSQKEPLERFSSLLERMWFE